jgi:hypothetical protein
VTPLEVALAGGAGGLIGAIALVPLVHVSRLLLDPAARRRDPPNPLAPGSILSEAITAPPDLLQMTAIFVQKIATGLFGTSLSLSQQRLYGTLWHLAYGTAWGIGYGVLQSSIPVSPYLAAPAYGLLVWLVGPAWLVPRMRLMLRVGQHAWRVTALVIAWHVLYGLILGATFAVLAGGQPVENVRLA